MSREKTADQELREAIDMVSQSFSDGDYGTALLLLRPLADAGVAEAIGMLALAYQKGMGVEVDSEKSIELFQKAIEMGDAIAAYHLGLLYKHGMPGVEINEQIANDYLQKAKDLGLNLTDI